jgi:hypothetical protein
MPVIRSMRHALLAKSPALTKAAKRLKRALNAGSAKSSAGGETGAISARSPEPAAARPFYPSSRAQRPIGIFYDELSRGINPFSLIESAGIADVTDPVEKITGLFDRFGIIKIRRFHSPERTAELNRLCMNFSGLEPLDFRDVFERKKKWRTGGAPALRNPDFWSYCADPKLQNIINALIGDNIFEFGSSVAAHYSARGLRREYGLLVGNDETPYSVRKPQKRIIRVLHYCGAMGGTLGYIPFSHDEVKFAEQARRVGFRRDTAWFSRHPDVLVKTRLTRNFTEADEIERHICRVHADPGDIIIVNPAMLHCGDFLTGPQYVFASAYAESLAETVALAANNARTGTAHDYYRHLSARSFKGSDDVLEALGLI